MEHRTGSFHASFFLGSCLQQFSQRLLDQYVRMVFDLITDTMRQSKEDDLNARAASELHGGYKMRVAVDQVDTFHIIKKGPSGTPEGVYVKPRWP